MIYLLLLIGFVFLIGGANLFVDGASGLAKRLRVPSIVIGLTIVAFGTSAPEAAVSLTASLAGNNDISLGNVVGSNIFNLLVVVGACAVLRAVPSQKEMLRRDMLWNIGITILLLVLGWDLVIGRVDGILLLVAFALYMFVLVRNARANRVEEETLEEMPLIKALLFILLGLAAVVGGGNLVVENASKIAKVLGMSDTLVGLTIVAVGTSLPELVTSIVASRKGDSGIAMGNAVGSCIFNILFILGMASTITSVHVSGELFIDIAILVGVTVLMLFMAWTKKKTSRLEGLFCLACYAGYMAYIILR